MNPAEVLTLCADILLCKNSSQNKSSEWNPAPGMYRSIYSINFLCSLLVWKLTRRLSLCQYIYIYGYITLSLVMVMHTMYIYIYIHTYIYVCMYNAHYLNQSGIIINKALHYSIKFLLLFKCLYGAKNIEFPLPGHSHSREFSCEMSCSFASKKHLIWLI